MNKDVIYIEPEDDITDILANVKAAKNKIIALVPPKKAGVLRSAVNFKLIAKTARVNNKTIVLISSDESLLKLASAVKMPVAKTLNSKPQLPTVSAKEYGDEPSDTIEAAKPAKKKIEPKAEPAEEAGEAIDAEVHPEFKTAKDAPKKEKEIETISRACRTCGRDIVLSLSPGAAPLEKAEHLKTYANMWRVSDDFWDEWHQLLAAFNYAEQWCIHSGPGHWPDADMLPIGALRQDYSPDDWSHFTVPELYTMMSLWCMMRSPLMIGGELTKMDDICLKLLTNAEVLSIEKTTAGAHPLYRNEEECVWVTYDPAGKAVYAALFNLSDEERTVSLSRDVLGMEFQSAKELWSGTCANEVASLLPPHGASVWRLE